MDVFGTAVASGGELMRDAALAAGHDLGIFDALSHGGHGGHGGPASLGQVADAIGVMGGRRRLRALLEVLAAFGAIACDRTAEPRFAMAAAVPPRPVVVPAGWGLIAEVIRGDRALPLGDDADGTGERRFHDHLVRAGAATAAELAAQLAGSSLLDLGSGAGAYSKAFLVAHPAARATLVDTRAVLKLAAEALGPLAARARLVEGDAGAVDVGTDHDIALLANVLHLHPPEVCARLCAAAARAVAPGGVVVIKDLRIDDDRGGPLESLLFALNMALYTDAGDVHATSQLCAWLAAAGLVDIEQRRLAAGPDAIVVLGRRPRCTRSPLPPDGVSTSVPERTVERVAASEIPSAVGTELASQTETEIAAELDAALARTADEAWRELAVGRAVDHAVGHAADHAAGHAVDHTADHAVRAEVAAVPPALAFPAALQRFLVRAIAHERGEALAGATEHAGQLVNHYTAVMPRMRVAQLAGTSEPGATLFHTPLDWTRLPRLAAAIDRLFAVLADARVEPRAALGAASAEAFRARTETLAALYERTHYGGFMPLLYGFPADLAYFHARGTADGLDVLGTIDRYLTAPIVHELCHFAPGRIAVAPPHLDECIAGWLGVHIHPELAYPAGDHDDALYAAPWLAQVGQAIARAFGVASLVRAHAGGDLAALPPGFVAAAEALGWDDWRARRTLHFLSDTFDPAPWVALALVTGAGHSPAGQTLAALATTSLAELTLPEDPAFDRAIVEDSLRAMCLASAQVAGSFRTRARLPGGPIAIDAVACAVVAPRCGELDPIAPRYWLPPAVAARIAGRHRAGYELRLATIAAIPAAAAAICDASPGLERVDFVLTPADHTSG